MGNERIAWIDVVRGVGILLVVVGHLSESMPPLHNLIYSFHMPLFFFLSGYCYKHDLSVDWKEFLRRKWQSLLVPWMCLGMLVYIFRALTISDIWTEISTFTTILFSIDALWFLPILFICCVMQRAILQIKSQLWQALFTVFFITFGGALSYLGIRDSMALTSSFAGTFFCMVGFYFQKHNSLMTIRTFQLSISILYFILSVVFIVSPPINMMFNIWGTSFFFSILRAIAGSLMTCYICWMATTKFPINIAKLQVLGRNTLTLLAFHLYFYSAFKSLLSGMVAYSNLISVILMFVSVYIVDNIIRRWCPFVVGKR